MDRRGGLKGRLFRPVAIEVLLAAIHQAVFAFHQGARCAANRVASGVVIPSAVAVPGAILVVGPHGVPRVTIVSAGCIWGAAIVRRPDSQRSAPVVGMGAALMFKQRPITDFGRQSLEGLRYIKVHTTASKAERPSATDGRAVAIAADSAPPWSVLLDPNQNVGGARDPSRSVGAPNPS